MSTNLPAQRLLAIEWLEGHIVNWNTNAAAIGLSAASVTALATEIANARQSYTNTQQIRAESKAKTTDFYSKTKTMHENASVMIQTIKAFAEAAPIPATVYTLAQVSPPAPPSPAAPPTQPVNLRYRVQPDGSIKLAWDAIGPSGTIFNVTRKLPAETSFTFIGQGDSSDKSFTDTAVPAGSTNASYRVQGVHGSLIGPQSISFTVYFGTADGAEEAVAA